LHPHSTTVIHATTARPSATFDRNSSRADPETVINLRGAWKLTHLTVYAELLNVLNDDGKDIVYYYPAHVEGLDPPGEEVDGRVSRAVEPRTVRAGIKYQF
jgi:outer membrane receptor protein involved in Fe transport